MTPNKIKQLRAELRMTVDQFAELFKRSGRTVEDWEQGRRTPDPNVVAKMIELRDKNSRPIDCDPELWAAMEAAAAKSGMSISEWVVNCALAKLPASVRKGLSERRGPGQPKKGEQPHSQRKGK